MDEYASYVWSAYLVATVVIIIMFITSVRALKKAQKTLEKLKTTEQN